MKVFSFSGNGNYSRTAGWDNGLGFAINPTSKSEANNATNLLSCVQEYAAYCAASHDTYGIWEDKNYFGVLRGIVIYTINQNGGSRNSKGYVFSDTPEKTLNRFSKDIFPVTTYVSQEERDMLWEWENETILCYNKISALWVK